MPPAVASVELAHRGWARTAVPLGAFPAFFVCCEQRWDLASALLYSPVLPLPAQRRVPSKSSAASA